MAPRASISPPMARNSGQAVWTTPCAPGTSGKAGNSSSTTSRLRYSPWDIARRANGWPWVWKIRMSRYSTPQNQTSISCICTSLACCRYASLRVANGSSPLAKTIYLMRGARRTGPRFSRLVIVKIVNLFLIYTLRIRSIIISHFTRCNILSVSILLFFSRKSHPRCSAAIFLRTISTS